MKFQITYVSIPGHPAVPLLSVTIPESERVSTWTTYYNNLTSPEVWRRGIIEGDFIIPYSWKQILILWTSCILVANLFE